MLQGNPSIPGCTKCALMAAMQSYWSREPLLGRTSVRMENTFSTTQQAALCRPESPSSVSLKEVKSGLKPTGCAPASLLTVNLSCTYGVNDGRLFDKSFYLAQIHRFA